VDATLGLPILAILIGVALLLLLRWRPAREIDPIGDSLPTAGFPPPPPP